MWVFFSITLKSGHRCEGKLKAFQVLACLNVSITFSIIGVARFVFVCLPILMGISDATICSHPHPSLSSGTLKYVLCINASFFSFWCFWPKPMIKKNQANRLYVCLTFQEVWTLSWLREAERRPLVQRYRIHLAYYAQPNLGMSGSKIWDSSGEK